MVEADEDPDAIERQLLADLEAVKRYKEVVARNRRAPQQAPMHAFRSPAPIVTRPVAPVTKRRQGGKSIAALSLETVDATWASVERVLERVRAKQPDATRSAVNTALGRFASPTGPLERRKGMRGSYEYRRRQSAATTQSAP